LGQTIAIIWRRTGPVTTALGHQFMQGVNKVIDGMALPLVLGMALLLPFGPRVRLKQQRGD
jgi:hypothetical protein